MCCRLRPMQVLGWQNRLKQQFFQGKWHYDNE
jgi:hypothetical protein